MSIKNNNYPAARLEILPHSLLVNFDAETGLRVFWRDIAAITWNKDFIFFSISGLSKNLYVPRGTSISRDLIEAILDKWVKTKKEQ